jgi:hypothetical protein
MTALLLCAVFAVGPQDAATLERAAFEYQLSIPSGHVETESVVTIVSLNGASRRISRKRTMYFDGENIREDAENPYDASKSYYGGRLPPGVSQATFWERRALMDGQHFSYSEQVDLRGKRFGAEVTKPNVLETGHHLGITDARWIGLTVSGSESLKNIVLRPAFDRPDMEISGVVKDSNKDASVVGFAYRRRDGVHGTIFIDTSKGPSVVGEVATSASGATVEEQDVDVRQHVASGYWFPVAMSYKHTSNGKLTQHEELKIKIISLGESLPRDTFTFAGLGLPIGSDVTPIGFDDNYQKIWTGRELVSKEPNVSSGAGGSQWWIWVVGWLALVTGLILMIAVYRRRFAT